MLRTTDGDGRGPRVRAIARGYVSWRSAHAAAMDTWRKTGRATFPATTDAMRGLPGVTVRDGPVLWQRA